MTDDMLNLDLIPEAFRADAVEALDAGNVQGFLIKAQSGVGLTIVYLNCHALKARGLYEEALLLAWSAPKFNHSHLPISALRFLFEQASREKLRAIGDPFPGPGPFVLYRGVAGVGRRRRERGFSWSDDFDRAKWFANRGNLMKLRNPAVVSTTVRADEVLAFVNVRQEREFILLPPREVQTVWSWQLLQTGAAVRSDVDANKRGEQAGPELSAREEAARALRGHRGRPSEPREQRIQARGGSRRRVRAHH